MAGLQVAKEACQARLEQRIGYQFTDRALLDAALTHRSFANENQLPLVDNERLEFLGDAVLALVIGHALYNAHNQAEEGELSRLRAHLVNAPALASLARQLELGECLLLGRGEARSGGRDRENLLADGLEALIGAVFCDGGYAAAAAVAGRLFAPLLTMPAVLVGHDYKTRLQELLQARQQPLPVYLLTAAHGPDHQRSYEVDVLVGGVVAGHGRGPTKKRAEQAAACLALEQLSAWGVTDA
jgi:ribonuclease-3